MTNKLILSSLPILVLILIAGPVHNDLLAAGKDKTPTLDNDPHLVGWWKFDETSGKVAADSSKYKRKGALKEDLSFDKASAPGKIGKAIRLDEDQYIQITKYKGIAGTKPRTVTAWVRTTRPRGGLVTWGEEDGGKMFNFCFIGGRGRVGISPRGGYYYMNETIHHDEWHHVAAVIKEAELPNLHDHAVLYLDGVVAEIHDIGLLDLWPIDTGSDLDVVIGDGFKGLLDDVRIYSRALSDLEMMALFKLQSNKPLPKPKK